MQKFPTFFLSIFVTALIVFATGCSKKNKIIKKPKVSKHILATKYTSSARHKATMRSYKVMGKRYYPCSVEAGQVMHGISSWYGPNFHGKLTSNGETYNMYARTAAHKTLPMDTMVKVTNKQNGKSTIVRINDRGPFVRGRIIDCSYIAGKEIGLDVLGIAKVKVEVLDMREKPKRESITSKFTKKLPNLQTKQGNYMVQVGAFKIQKGAEDTKHNYATMYSQYKPVVRRFIDANDQVIYKVLLLGFSSEKEIRDFKYNNLLDT